MAITGGTGFLGQAVIAHWRTLSPETEIIVLSRRPDQVRGTEVRTCDYGDPGSVEKALKGAQALIHLAGIAHAKPGRYSRDDYKTAIVDATRNLATAATRAGVQTFVFASSVKVFGETAPPGTCLDEDSPCRPTSDYGRFKLEAEALLESLEAALSVRILRFPPIFGPGSRGAVRHLLKAVKRRLPLPVHGLKNERSFLFVENAARIVRAAAQGELGRLRYVAQDSDPILVGEFYATAWATLRGSPIPGVLKWRMPDALAKRLADLGPVAPLFEHFPVVSKFRPELDALKLQPLAEALRLSLRQP